MFQRFLVITSLSLLFSSCQDNIDSVESSSSLELAFPEAEFHMKGVRYNSCGSVGKNFSTVEKSNKRQYSSRGSEETDKGKQAMGYEFIAKSKYGDIYIVKFEIEGEEPKLETLIYSGVEAKKFSYRGMSVEIRPEKKF